MKKGLPATVKMNILFGISAGIIVLIMGFLIDLVCNKVSAITGAWINLFLTLAGASLIVIIGKRIFYAESEPDS